MSGSVIVAGARTPIGRLLGSLSGLPGVELGGIAIKAALERAGVAPEAVEYVIMGQVLQAGAGQIPSRQAAVKAGHPDDRPVADDQQGLPVRARRHRPGRPAHPGGRVRHRGRGRHGVHDQRPAPAARSAQGRQVRRRRDAGLDGPRRAVPTRSTRCAMGESTERHNARARHRPARSRTPSPPAPTSAPPRRSRTASSTTRSSRWRSRSARASRWSSTTDEGVRADTTVEIAGPAAAGVHQGRHDHGRLRLADLRRRLRGGRDVQGQGRGAGPGVAGRDRRPRQRGRARTTRSSPSPPTRSSTPSASRASPSADLDLRGDQRGVRPGRAPVGQGARRRRSTRSTSTAAASRSATRSAPPAPASCSRWPTSSSAAAAAWAPPGCAAAAARATP